LEDGSLSIESLLVWLPSSSSAMRDRRFSASQICNRPAIKERTGYSWFPL
jgi:hypothetical protein